MVFVKPMIEEQDLQNLSEIEFEKFRPEFISQVIAFREDLFSSIRVKTLGDQVLSGELFGRLVQQYVQAINEKQIPVIENTWYYVAMEHNMKQVDKCVDSLQETLRESLKQMAVDKKTFAELFNGSKAQAEKEL